MSDTHFENVTRVRERVVLTIRCWPEEAEAIRAEAQRTRRSISGYMVHAALTQMRREESGLAPQKKPVVRAG